MENSNVYYLEEAPVKKAIAYMAIPMILAMFTGVIQNLSDSFFIGKLNNPNMLAGVMLCLPIVAVFMAVSNIFGVGGSSYISRLLGEKEYDKIKNVSAFSFYSSIVVGIIVTIIMLFNLDRILIFIGASSSTILFAKMYAKILASGAVLFIVSFGMGTIIRAEGASKEAMIGMLIGTIGNIILLPITIFYLNLGVSGSAYATLIANMLAVIYYIWYFVYKSPFLSINIKYLKFDLNIIKNIFVIGIPVFIQFLFLAGTSVILNNYAGKYGDYVIVIIGLAVQINMIPEFLVSGLCEGVQPLIGYNYTSGNKKRMQEIINNTAKLSLGISIVIGLISLSFSQSFLNIFVNDSQVLAQGAPLFRILLLAQVAYGIIFLFTNVFQSLGKAKEAMAMSIVQGLGYLPAIIIGDYLFKLNGIIWAFPVSEFLIALISLGLFLKIKKEIYNEVL